jgi:hypothetical protein
MGALQTALAGFALMSAGALLNILLGSLLASKGHSDNHEGGLVDKHTTTTTTQEGGFVRSAFPVRFFNRGANSSTTAVPATSTRDHEHSQPVQRV